MCTFVFDTLIGNSIDVTTVFQVMNIIIDILTFTFFFEKRVVADKQ